MRYLQSLVVVVLGTLTLGTGIGKAAQDDFSIPLQERRTLLESDFGRNMENANAIILLDRSIYKIDHLGNLTKTRNLLIKILTDQGKTEYADVKAKFNARMDRIEWGRLCTISPDNLEIPIANNAINTFTPSTYQNALLYQPIKLAVISFPSVGKNAVTELNMRIHSAKEKWGEHLFGTEIFREHDPILRKEVILEYPVKRHVYSGVYNTQNYHIQEEETHSKDYVRKVYRLEKIEGYTPEEFMPKPETIFPTLYFTTFRHWQEVKQWFKDRILPTQDAQSLLSIQEKGVKNIYKFMVEDIKTVSISAADLLYKNEGTQSILDNHFGTTIGKTGLLFSLLENSQKGDWHLAMVGPATCEFKPEIPAPFWFENLCCYNPKKNIFLSPKDEFTSYGDPSEFEGKVLLSLTDDIEIMNGPPRNPESNRIECSFTLIEDKNDYVKESFKTKICGVFASMARMLWKHEKPEMLLKTCATYVRNLAETGFLQEYIISNSKNLFHPPSLEMKFSAKDAWITEGNFRFMYLSDAPAGFLLLPIKKAYQIRKRRFPLHFRNLFTWKATYEFTNSLCTPYFIPPSKVMKTPYAEWQIKPCQEGDKISITKTFRLLKTRIPLIHFEEFRHTLIDFFSPRWEVLVFESP